VQKKSKVYRANRWKELDETWHVGKVIIVGVPFYGLKGIRNKIMEI